jgi:hypothetical protein
MPLDLQLYLVLVVVTVLGLILVFRRERREDGTLVMDLQRMRAQAAVDRLNAQLDDPLYDWQRHGL